MKSGQSVIMQQPYKSKSDSFLKRFAGQWDLQIMAIPPMLLVILFAYIPMWGILFAFKDYSIFKGFLASPWAGFKHFQMLFNAPEFPVVMRNTLAISFLKFLCGFPAPIILALMLNEVRSQLFKRSVQTITYLPHFVSWVVVSGLVFNLFASGHGLVNDILVSLNIIKDPVDWLLTPKYFWGILVSTGIWKDAGFGAIIYLAAIAGVDLNMYEAAEIDGANRFQKIIHITLPAISNVVVVLMILQVGNILNAGFEDIFLLTNNTRNFMLLDVANTIDIYVYREGIQNMRYSYGTAAGLFKGVLNVALLMSANYMARRFGRASLY